MGDLVLVIDNNIMKSGIIRDIPIVIDIEDKVTAKEEECNKKNLLSLVLRTLNSLIGETSNCATSYINKVGKTERTKKRYLEYVDILSIINGKNIDYSKTGVMINIPRKIAKYSKPLPYFMKYARPYYRNMKLSKSQTNMNRLCWEIEKWERETILYNKKPVDFDYTIMMDESIEIDKDKYNKIKPIFLEYGRETKELSSHQYKFNNYKKYMWWIKDFYPDLKEEDIPDFKFDWNGHYEKYKDMCAGICPNEQELANIVVHLCYVEYPKRNKGFIWKVAENGILKNIKLHKKELYLPALSSSGRYEYLGRYYDMERLDVEFD